MKKFIIIVSIALFTTVCYAQKKEKYTKTLNYKEFSIKIADPKAKEWVFLGDKPAIVDFWATWCPPCKKMSPILEELAKEYEGLIDIYKVDGDKNGRLTDAYNIESYPTIYFIYPGESKPHIVVGGLDKDVLKFYIDGYLLRRKVEL